ncbi:MULTISPECIES: ArsR family transcriptional regulator [unclassified Maridesulfovibrio]|uniref:VpaChn25_0724 family phage protein n=1 Tax=unclassified Maridesulfovibrio TaxID=2794999 RepID=UPI003B3FDDE3
MNYGSYINESLRLCILRILMEIGGATANESLIEKISVKRFAFSEDRERLRTQIKWLAARGLVTLPDDCEKCLTPKLTAEGKRVATGLDEVEGVDMPSL